MNGWTFLIVLLLMLVATSEPIVSQVDCAIGVETACTMIELRYEE